MTPGATVDDGNFEPMLVGLYCELFAGGSGYRESSLVGLVHER